VSDHLSKIDSPEDLKSCTPAELVELAAELRDYIITNVSITGGHLAPSLGVVELTLALHHVFDCPRDKIIWDVGHQAYAHKILTGRRDRFRQNRQHKGISGFPNRSESEYDAFGTGHASTSISAGYGMVCARDTAGEDYHVVSVIGDGSMTGGLAFEGLNNAGASRRNFIVVLNDNTMSISPNVGALSKYLAFLITDRRFTRLKKEIWDRTLALPQGNRIARSIGRLEASIKAMLVPGLFFEQLGFRYIGPLDGHNLDDLVRIFRQVRELHGPILVHVLTRKGKGYLPAEQNATKFHGIGSFIRETGAPQAAPQAPTYTSVFGKTVVKLAEKHPGLVAITAAMADGTGLSEFAHRFPDRFHDVGIAEGHAVTFAAGLAAQGLRPLVAIYSSFLQRGYDQIIHDVALQKLPVIFALDRGGLVGEDGPTHHGCFDLGYLRHIPNLVILAPRDENELQHMLYTAVQYQGGPLAVRYPRAEGAGCPLDPEASWREIEIGRAEVARVGSAGAILTLGTLFSEALQAADLVEAETGMALTVVNMRSLKPLDRDLLRDLATRFDRLMTVEEGALPGGFGSAVMEAIEEMDLPLPRFRRRGIVDQFIEQGDRAQLLRQLGLDAPGLARVAREFFAPAREPAVVMPPGRLRKTHDIRHHRQHPERTDLGSPPSVSRLAGK